jgi:hypothetical protein
LALAWLASLSCHLWICIREVADPLDDGLRKRLQASAEPNEDDIIALIDEPVDDRAQERRIDNCLGVSVSEVREIEQLLGQKPGRD